MLQLGSTIFTFALLCPETEYTCCNLAAWQCACSAIIILYYIYMQNRVVVIGSGVCVVVVVVICACRAMLWVAKRVANRTLQHGWFSDRVRFEFVLYMCRGFVHYNTGGLVSALGLSLFCICVVCFCICRCLRQSLTMQPYANPYRCPPPPSSSSMPRCHPHAQCVCAG